MEERPHPSEFLAERDALVVEIHAVFEGVSREGGVSWNEAGVLDGFGTEAECLEARSTDKDATWVEVLNDPDWSPWASWGGWSFLDGIGFRYYLPAAMIIALRLSDDAGFAFHLVLPQDELTEYFLDQWSSFSHRERLTIKRFIEHMVRVAPEDRTWTKALESYWGGIGEDQEPTG